MQIFHLNVWIDISFIYSISDHKYIFKKKWWYNLAQICFKNVVPPLHGERYPNERRFKSLRVVD